MRIAMVTVALRLRDERTAWVTVPPQGYSGVHWVVAHLAEGLSRLGHEVLLLGAPGSPVFGNGVTVVDAGEPADTSHWLRTAPVDLVHDHSCGQLDLRDVATRHRFISTHHMTGRPKIPVNCVYLSEAQRTAAASEAAPVIPIPVNARHHRFRRDKEDYLLFLGRVSPFKGAYEAAAFARAARRHLVIAGPTRDAEYRRRIETDFGSTVSFVGEVGGNERADLLAGATALLAMSQTVLGPWGHVWCEPGATVVSEAAVSGTPVIATPNGCLGEIVPPVGTLVPEGSSFSSAQAAGALSLLPPPDRVRQEALRLWDYMAIANRYQRLYELLLAGKRWDLVGLPSDPPSVTPAPAPVARSGGE